MLRGEIYPRPEIDWDQVEQATKEMLELDCAAAAEALRAHEAQENLDYTIHYDFDGFVYLREDDGELCGPYNTIQEAEDDRE